MIQIPEDVGMVELHAGENSNDGVIMQELGSLVEIGRVIFIPFHHQVVSVTQIIVAAEICQNTTDNIGSPQSGAVKQPGNQGRCSGFSMGSGNENGLFPFSGKGIDGLGHGTEA